MKISRYRIAPVTLAFIFACVCVGFYNSASYAQTAQVAGLCQKLVRQYASNPEIKRDTWNAIIPPVPTPGTTLSLFLPKSAVNALASSKSWSRIYQHLLGDVASRYGLVRGDFEISPITTLFKPKKLTAVCIFNSCGMTLLGVEDGADWRGFDYNDQYITERYFELMTPGKSCSF